MSIKIYGAYQWELNQKEGTSEKNKTSANALLTIVGRLKARVKLHDKSDELKIQYARLRATSGGFILDTIHNRMENAYALIFDITQFNPNVMLELGMALQMQRCLKKSAKVFLIAHAEKYSDLKMPGDLQGFFVSTYKVNNDGSIVFGDQNSLVMRMTSDIVSDLDGDYIEMDLDEK
jgi:hypothetical protein